MKLNRIIIAGILLLAIITLGVASAADSEEISLANTDEIDLESAENTILSEKQNWDMNIVPYEDRILENDTLYAFTDDNKDIEENLKKDDFNLTIDDKPHEFEYEYGFKINTSDLSIGKHNFTFAFKGSENLNPATSTGSFEIAKYLAYIDDEYIYGQDSNAIVVYTPISMAGENITLISNGIRFSEVIDDKVYVGRGFAAFNVNGLLFSYGKNNVTVLDPDGQIIAEKTVNVNYTFQIGEVNAKYGYDDVQISDNGGVDLTNIIVKIDGKEVEYYIDSASEFTKNIRVKTTPDLNVGVHKVSITHPADDRFPEKTFNGTLRVQPLLEVDLTIINATGGFHLMMPDDAKGNLIIVVKKFDELEFTEFANVTARGNIYIPLDTLPFGMYNFDYTYTGDDYTVDCYYDFFTINPDITLPLSEIGYGEKAYVTVNLLGYNGTVTVRVSGKESEGTSSNLLNGKATHEVPFLTTGINKYFVQLTIGQFNNESGYFEGNTYFYDFNVTVNPKITYPEARIPTGQSASVEIQTEGVNGTVIVRENVKEGEGHQADLVNGKATVAVANLVEGKHTYYVQLDVHTTDEWNITRDKGQFVYFFDVEVINPITAKDGKALYSANEKYTAHIKDENGKATFYILDGKKQILKKTVDVKNGIATLTYKITQGVKTYTVKTVFNKAEVTRKLTVNHVVNLNSATVKKSAKSLTLKATLKKVNGKYLSKKQVTFKFNGKTFKTKTNSKGVAKVTVPKTVLSKLTVGKKIIYQATYLKDTVKRTAKVKK